MLRLEWSLTVPMMRGEMASPSAWMMKSWPASAVARISGRTALTVAALTGPGFYGNWEGETLNALFERIRMSMPADNPGSLSRAQNADIIAHLLRVHLRDRLEAQVSRLEMPGLALRAADDRLSTDDWLEELARIGADFQWVKVPGAHAFVWTRPEAWSDPLRRLAERAS